MSTGTSPEPVVLVVEDDPINLQIVRDLLGANGMRTIGAANGKEAIAAYEREHPQLVLIDVQLPGGNGFEVCRRLRALPGGTDTPMLMMSAVYADPEHIASARAQGVVVDAYLAKPFDVAELLAVCRRLLGIG